MLIIIQGCSLRIAKHRSPLFKTHAMLKSILSGFRGVPLEIIPHHLAMPSHSRSTLAQQASCINSSFWSEQYLLSRVQICLRSPHAGCRVERDSAMVKAGMAGCKGFALSMAPAEVGFMRGFHLQAGYCRIKPTSGVPADAVGCGRVTGLTRLHRSYGDQAADGELWGGLQHCGRGGARPFGRTSPETH
jgi:hypothetical protein